MGINDVSEITSEEKLWNKQAALARLAGNEKLLSRIVEMFLAQIQGKQDALNNAISDADIEAIRFTSHAMKGVSGDVGADAVREQAAYIEQKAKQSDISNIVEDNQRLRALVSATVKLMR